MKFFKITHIAAGAVLAALAATGQASADQGTIMNVHVGLGGQEGGAAGGCVDCGYAAKLVWFERV